LPIGLIKIGPIKIASLPGETSSAMGGRIERSLGNTSSSPTLVTSLANEYISYFTTPSEYAMQHYEGGFTVYGQATAPFFEEELIKLDGKGPHFSEYYGEKEYDVGPLGLDKSKLKSDLNNVWNLGEKLDQIKGESNPLFQESIEISWEFVPVYLHDYEKGNLFNYNPEVFVEKKDLDGNWKLHSWTYIKDEKAYSIDQHDNHCANFISALETDDQEGLVWKTTWFHAGTLQAGNEFRICNTYLGQTTCKEIRP